MEQLGIPRNTIEILRKHQFNIQKRYGQNFLIDTNVLEKIMRAAFVSEEDCVLEVGPGLGTMTQRLAQHARKVLAVEIDRNLIPILEENLSVCENVKIIQGDILKVDIKALVEEENAGRPIRVVANLPYYITTPIIMGLLEKQIPLKSITVMVQKEVADRMQAGPGTKDYGALSLAVQYYAKPEIVAHVPSNCFLPRPAVGSAVIHLSKYEELPVQTQDPEKMFAIIKAAFNQRRKTLANSLLNAGGLAIPRERTLQALECLKLPATVRGEALTLEQFAALSGMI